MMEPFKAEHTTCPSCNTVISYYDANSSFYGCPACHTFFEHVHDDPPRVIVQFGNHSVYQPHIAIGTDCTLGKERYVVAGFMVREELDDDGEHFKWEEYLLHKEDGANEVLVSTDGHWLLVRKTREHVNVQAVTQRTWCAYSSNTAYELQHSYKFRVLYACGEFDWNVLDDERMVVYEYVNMPEILVCEIKDEASQWYRGEYLTKGMVKHAFPKLEMVYSNFLFSAAESSSPFRNPDYNWKPLIRVTMVAVVLVLLIQWGLGLVQHNKVVLREAFLAQRDTAATSLSLAPQHTASFTIDGPSATEVVLGAAIDNDWVELSGTLVNDQTGATYDFSRALEYYHGYDGGESWSEGSQQESAILSSIPSGTYHLNLYPVTDRARDVEFFVEVQQHTFLTSNLVIALLLILAYPLVLALFRNIYFKNADNY